MGMFSVLVLPNYCPAPFLGPVTFFVLTPAWHIMFLIIWCTLDKLGYAIWEVVTNGECGTDFHDLCLK